MSVKSFYTVILGLLIIVSGTFLQPNTAFANSNLSVTPAGPAIRLGTNTIQNITINMKTKRNWQLSVVPLSNSFKNITNPASLIPVSQAEIQDNSSSSASQLEFGKPVVIASGNDNNNISKNFIIRIQTPDSYYPGTYTGSVLFTLTSSHGISMQNFDISFDQPTVMDISIPGNEVNIDVIPENSMLNNYSQEAPSPTRLYIRSNKNWKLILTGQNIYNPVTYFFKTLSGSGNPTLYYSDYTQLSNTSFIIAEGSPTVSSDGKSMEPNIIQINYKLLTDKYSILTAGSYPYNIVFNLAAR